MSDYILAIDQGTTGSTVLIVEIQSDDARVVARGYAEFPQHFPEPGQVEHELSDIWGSVKQATTAALGLWDKDPSELSAIGITNQRETTGIWDLSSQPIHRAIVWQDRRTAEQCKKLQEAGHLEKVRARTGLVLDPYFSGTKLAWILDHVEGARERATQGELRFGTMDTWVLWMLTSGDAHLTDATNAGRTMLFDIVRGEWDEELCAIIGDIPASILPEVRSSSEFYGKTRGLDFLPDGIPITGIAGDQHAALFGQTCFETGMAKCTYGTGAFALINTGDEMILSERGLLTTIAWKIGDKTTYALEGSVFVAGAVVQWLRDNLGFIETSSEIEELAKEVDDNGGVTLVPALTGLGAPHWRPEARGLITGITRGTERAHIARAALEGIALQVYDLLDAMQKDSGKQLAVLRVDGGASANELLMQFQSDILNVTIHRPDILDTTALGAAFLAALGQGIYTDFEDIKKTWNLDRSWEPKSNAEKTNEHITRWHAALEKA